MTRDTIVTDLDSTLCNTEHRHLTSPLYDPEKTWQDYSMLCSADTPMVGTVRLLQLYALYYRIAYLSGRDECAEDLTVDWLQDNGCPPGRVYLRHPDDPTDLIKYKVLRMQDLMDDGHDPVLYLDDHEPTATAIQNTFNIPTIVVNPCYSVTLDQKLKDLNPDTTPHITHGGRLAL